MLFLQCTVSACPAPTLHTFRHTGNTAPIPFGAYSGHSMQAGKGCCRGAAPAGLQPMVSALDLDRLSGSAKECGSLAAMLYAEAEAVLPGLGPGLRLPATAPV